MATNYFSVFLLATVSGNIGERSVKRILLCVILLCFALPQMVRAEVNAEQQTNSTNPDPTTTKECGHFKAKIYKKLEFSAANKDELVSIINAYKEKYNSEPLDGDDKPAEIIIAKTDLNKDGIDEIFVTYRGQAMGVSTGFPADIMQYKNNKLHIIDSMMFHPNEVYVLENVSNGYRDLYIPTWVPKGANEVVMQWNGNGYEHLMKFEIF